MDEIHDTSRLDAFMRSRQRVALLNAVWRPMLAGALGAALMIAAVYVTLPKLSYREIEVPRVSYKDAEVPRIVPHDVTVDHVVPHDVPIDIPIPRLVPAAPEASAAAPRSKEAFVASPEYRTAELSGRIAGAYGNGFRFEDGQTFSPARIVNDRIEQNEDVFDDISGLIGAPAYCSPLPNTLYVCRAWREGRGVVDIPVRPVPRAPRGGKPTRAPSTVVTRPAIEARR
jgi:hypothetical protein